MKNAKSYCENRFQAFFENINIGFAICDTSGKFLNVNQAFCDLTGYTKKELYKIGFEDITYSEDLTTELPLLEQAKYQKINDYKIEKRYVKKDKTIIWVEIFVAIIRDTNGEPVQLIGSVYDISSRKEAEEKLKQSQKEWQYIFQAINHPTFILDENHYIIDVNDAVIRKSKKSKDQLIGKPCFSIFHGYKTNHSPKNCPAEALLKSGREQSVEMEMEAFDGIYLVSCTPIFDERKKLKYIIHIATDITYLKTIENELNESQLRYKVLLDTAPVGIAVHREGKIEFVNKTGSLMLGATDPDRFIGSSIEEIVHPDNLETSKARIGKLLSGVKGLYPAEDRYIKLDGTTLDVQVYATLINYKGGSAIQVVVSDITQQKKLARNLIESQGKFEKIFMSSPESIFLATFEDGKYLDVNDSFLSLTGYTRDEVIGKPNRELNLWNESNERLRLIEVFKRDGQIRDFESVIQTRNDKQVYVSLSADKIQIGDIICIICQMKNVTDRKIYEEKLRNSERNLKTFVQYAPAAIAMFDTEMRYLVVSQRFITDYRIEEFNLTGKSHYEVFPEIPPFIKEVHKRCLEGKTDKCDEAEFIRKDGYIDWIRWEVHPWYQEDKRIGGILLFSEVITNRKLAEERIKSSEEKFAKLFQLSPDAITLSRQSDRLIEDVNESACQITGFSREELIGKPILSLQFWNDPDELDRYKRQLMESTSTTSFEAQFRTKSGEIKIGLVSNMVVSIKNEKYLMDIIRDITSRKKYEQDLILAKEKAESDERKLKVTQELAKMGSWELDIHSGMFTFSDNFYKIYHTSVQEMGGYQISINDYASLFVHPDDAPKIAEESRKAIETNDPNFNNYVEHRIKYFDGGYGYIGVWFFIIKDKWGETIKTYGVNQDITAIKLAELELIKAKENAEENEYFLRASQNAGNVGSYRTDFRKGFWKSSEALDRIFGIDADYGRNVDGWLSIIHPDDRQMMNDYLINEVIGNREIFAKEYRIIRNNDKAIRWVFGYGDVSFDDKGNILEMIGTIQDITERKKIETDLVKAKEKAEESDRLKSAFLQNISHEIRTPLNAIIGFSSFLGTPALPAAKRDEFINIINVSTDQLLSIVSGIIALAALDTGQEHVNEKETNLNQLLHDVYEQLLVKQHSNQVTITYHPSLPDELSLIYTDPVKLIQILINLVGNSLKFTHLGSIKFGYTVIHDKLNFYVEDTGIGIPEDMHEVIFKRFSQVDSSATRKYGGTGLGLSLSKGYVELLGGQITLKSSLGKGSVFNFSIPYKPVSDRSLSKAADIDSMEMNLPKGKTILVAEDEDNNFYLIEYLLTTWELNIVRAENGLQAVSICSGKDVPDLVLMDIKMPIMDGMEATKAIKEFRPGLPIIAVTAYTLDIDKKRIYESGCDDYIEKPLNLTEISKVLSKFLKENNQ